MAKKRNDAAFAGRSAGVLLHPTSLPGRHGIGDLGPEARQFVDILAHAKQTWWQMLPLTPPGEGESPYKCYSAFAGNSLLISLEDLAADGLVAREELRGWRGESAVDFGRVRTFKLRLLEHAWLRFREGKGGTLRRGFAQFRKEKRAWLEDYALFVAIREAHGGEVWQRWPRDLVRRRPKALAAARRQLGDAVERECFIQFLFWRQIRALKAYANARGIQLIGDLPIFVAGESADVWTNPELFKLDRDNWPRVVAGVPPDIFSNVGQMWGNPLYAWRAMARTGYSWWIERVRAVLEQCDVARIDHFRGFAAAWEIPAKADDARTGKWVKGPGENLFRALRKGLGGLPLIAEDLGLITPDVITLRDQFGLSGMRILQFGFKPVPHNPHLPHNYLRESVAYTGTHDNDTSEGWYRELQKREKARVVAYLPGVDDAPARAMMRAVWESVAGVAIAPVQDVLEMGGEARMNTPGTETGNWGWRLRAGELKPAALKRLRTLTETSDRCAVE